MFSLNQTINFNKPELIIIVPSAGLSSNFAGDLLIHNNDFIKIGYYYSKYLSTVAGVSHKGDIIMNGELFYNESINKLMLFLRAGIHANLMDKFFTEFNALLNQYEIQKVTLLGSTSTGGFNTDFEVSSETVNVYCVNNSSLCPENFGIIKFDQLLKKDNKKNLDELNYIEGGGLATKLVKLLNKAKINYTFLLTFSSHLFDPTAGFTLYYKYLYMIGVRTEDRIFNKIERIDETTLKKENLIYDITWSYYLI